MPNFSYVLRAGHLFNNERKFRKPYFASGIGINFYDLILDVSMILANNSHPRNHDWAFAAGYYTSF